MDRRKFLGILIGSAALMTAATANAGGHLESEKKMKDKMKGKSADHRKDEEMKKKGHEMKDKGKEMKDKMMKEKKY